MGVTVDANFGWDEWIVPEAEPFEIVLGRDAADKIRCIVRNHLKNAFEDLAETTEWDCINGQIRLWAAKQTIFGEDLPVRISISPVDIEVAIKRDLDRDWREESVDRFQQIDYSIKKWQAALDRCSFALEQAVQDGKL